jgi:hypothetical protein
VTTLQHPLQHRRDGRPGHPPYEDTMRRKHREMRVFRNFAIIILQYRADDFGSRFDLKKREPIR